AIVHFMKGVNDEIDGGAKSLRDRELAVEPLLGLAPIFHPIGQPLVVDDDEEIIVRLIAFGGMRLIDEGAAGVRAVKNDLEDPALLLPLLGRKAPRLLELLEQDCDDPFQLALLGGRQMIDVAAHQRRTLRAWMRAAS